MVISSRKVVVVILLLLAGVAFAPQQITTPVRFILPTVTSFTLAIPGNNATNFSSSLSGVTATTLIFNTTNLTEGGINATAAGTSTVQGPTVSIFNITNTGNIKINVTINFSTALPGGVEVKAGWGPNAYQTGSNGCTGPAAGPPGGATEVLTTCSNITASQIVTTVANMSTSGRAKYRDVWLWADYSSVAAGTDTSVNMVFISLNLTG